MTTRMTRLMHTSPAAGWSGRLLLLCLLLVISATAGKLYAQATTPQVKVYDAAGTLTATHSATDWKDEEIPVNLKETAVKIVATGTWTPTQMGGLRCALKNETFATAPNSTLTEADLSGITITGYDWNTNGFTYLFSKFSKLTSVKMPTTSNSTTISFLYTFSSCSALTEIDLSGFTNVSNFYSTFSGCSALTSVKLSTVTNTASMSFYDTFSGCSALKEMDLSKFTNVSNFTQTFSGCSALTSVKLPDTTSAEDIWFSSTFYGCSELEEIDLSGFTNMNNFSSVFYGCSKLTSVKMPTADNNISISFGFAFNGCSALNPADEIDLSGFKNVRNFGNTFSGCSALTTVKMPAGTTNAASISFANTFYNCSVLKPTVEIDLSGFTNVSNFSGTFSGCFALTSVKLPTTTSAASIWFTNTFSGCSVLNPTDEIDLSGFTNVRDFGGTFSGCSKLVSVTMPTTTSSNASISFASTFKDCKALKLTDGINLSGFSNVSNFSGTFSGCSALTSVTMPTATSATAPISFESTFKGCNALKSMDGIDLNGFANVNNFDSTFYNCPNLVSVKMPTTPNANSISFNSTFTGCSKLNPKDGIDLSGFSNVSNFSNTFQDCSALVSVTLPATTSAASISFDYAFEGCLNLNPTGGIDLSGFTQVSNFSNTFQHCYELTSIKMPTVINNTSISFYYTFYNCKELNPTGGIDLSSFTNVSDFIATFFNCPKLVSVKMPTGKNTNSISFNSTFTGCYKLNPEGGIDLSGFTNVSAFVSTFNNCYSLTSVRLGKISTSNLSGTFTNANPNMLKYLPKETATIPATWSNASYTNFIKGIDDTDGTPVAYGDIVLKDEWTTGTTKRTAPYACPLAFTIPNEKTISYTRDFTGRLDNWQSIVLPFDAVSVNGTLTADACNMGSYRVARYASADAQGYLTFYDAATIAANKPHIVMLPAAGISDAASVRFISKESDGTLTVPVTPASLTTPDTSGDFSYTGTLLGTADKAYYLGNNDNKFTKDDTQTGVVGSESQPFRAYFTATATTSLDALSINSVVPDPACPVTWKGAGAGSNADNKNLWSIASNWEGDKVPADGTAIIYHADAIDLHVDGTRTAASITNTTTAGLVVLPGASLTLAEWDAADNVTSGGGSILIQAETTGDSPKANGSFLVPKNSTVDAAVEFQSRAINDKKVDEGIMTQSMKWQYFGIPVESCVGNSFYGAWVREYMHADNSGGSGKSVFWEWLDAWDPMAPMQGYEVSVPSDHSAGGRFRLSGTLLTSDQSQEVTRAAEDPYPGQWVLSNPFTAGVNVKDIVFGTLGTEFEKSIWLFNTGSFADWEGKEEPIEGDGAPGQYTVIPANTDGMIASMQGFVVKLADAQISSTITLPYPAAAAVMPTLRSQQRQRGVQAAQESQTTAHEKIYTDIALLSGDGLLKDRMQIYTDPRTTRGYDNGWDGRKMFGAAHLAALYSPEADGNYQVNALPDMGETYLSMKAETGTRDYALRFTHHNTAAAYDGLWLHDLELGIDVDITADSSMYHFTAANETAALTRFRITSTRREKTLTQGIELYREDSQICISNYYAATVSLHIYTASGRLLMSRHLPPLNDIRLPASLFAQGVYIVEGRTESGEMSVVKMVSP